jgi:hypothetical protein
MQPGGGKGQRRLRCSHELNGDRTAQHSSALSMSQRDTWLSTAHRTMAHLEAFDHGMQ